ncbi:MAG: hypothetical protein MAG715_00385 [Methanonatronarchaeales archaeon]|nr:hypothetical protein [Methanonatronarchaeales archaeon]
MKLLVVGGAGEMGRWFARELGRDFDVSIHDVDLASARTLAEDRGYDLCSPEDAGEFDVVMLAVPIGSVERVAREVGPHMSGGSLLLDVTSVKAEPVEAMEDAAPDPVEVLGTHPMFGPTADSLRGQTVILTPVDDGDWTQRMGDLLRSRGAHVEVTTPEEHDEMMSVIQGLTHFSYVSFGCALEELDFDVSASRRFMSPVYEVMIDFAGRILDQDPNLYAEIQAANPLNRGSREALIRAAEELAGLCGSGKIDEFVERMRSASNHFGDTSASLRKSDKLVGTLVEERETLMGSVGEEIGLLNTRTGVVHVGRLVSYTPEIATLRETGGEVRLKTANARLLPPEEVESWKAENLPLQRRDVSVVTGDHADPGTLARTAASVDGVSGAEALDEYFGDPVPEGFKSVTLRLEILYGNDAYSVEDEVRTTLRGLGLELR